MTENKTTFTYNDVLESFGQDKVAQRYDNIMEQLKAYIKRNSLEKNVCVCSGVVNQLVIDYFTDIYRLKEFHQIDLTNFIKITAYTAYWIVRRKPLQIVQDDIKNVELAFCNENFVLSYIMRFLQDSGNAPIDESGQYHEFVSTLSYALRYRTLTPQMLELMIEGFRGGSVYQKECGR